ncbi:hypothetical protein ACFQXB_10650 [Plastorhodobacter daqingensis]|uniref:ATP-grasp domain-containing protein n=1 Tax=Plastorhodobacter daqingensis TaxID=1387281 RepID=A0ABW2UIY2_9RHOB
MPHEPATTRPSPGAPDLKDPPLLGALIHPGMPALAPGPLYPMFKRRLNDPVFYLLPALMWLGLALRHGSLTLPTAANPSMEVGGLWGESKAQGLGLFGPVGRQFTAPYVVLCRGGESADAAEAEALAALRGAGIDFPVVAKPDRGYQGWGVRALQDVTDLRAYLAPAGAGLRILLQKLVRFQGEAGIFYIREPGAARGRIVSLALNYAPHVIGDGRKSVADLVVADPVLAANRAVYQARSPAGWGSIPAPGEVVILTNARSARLGAVYRSALDQVTPALEEIVDTIAREIPDFHFGRFDIRFSSLEALQEGRDFLIVELNGAGAEMLHLWEGATSLSSAYRTLWRQYRKLFAIGAAMRRQGHRPAGLRQMLALQRRQERLRKAYPPSS